MEQNLFKNISQNFVTFVKRHMTPKPKLPVITQRRNSGKTSLLVVGQFAGRIVKLKNEFCKFFCW